MPAAWWRSDPERPVGPENRKAGELGCTFAVAPKVTNGHPYLSLWEAGPRPGLAIWLPRTPGNIQMAVQYGIIILNKHLSS